MPILAAIGIGGPQLAGLFATTIFGRHTAKRAKKKAEAVAREQAEAARAAMNLKFNTTSNVGNLPVVYGAVRMGGFYCLQEVSADKKFLHIVIAHAEGRCGAATMLYLDGTAYTDPKFKKKTKAQVKSGKVIEIRTPVNGPPYPVEVDRYIEQETAQDLVVWEYFDGADDQAACASLIAALPAKWTANHKLSGVAYSYVRLEWNPDVWRAVPIITVDMTGKLVYDPRNGTTTASKNPALALRDYLLSSRYGRGLTVGGVNDSAIIAEANYCDQLIDMGHGTPVPRYAISGMIDTSKACLDNVQELMEHMRGSLLYIDDVYSLVLDKADVPVMSIDSDILVGKVQIKAADRRDKLNQLVGRFIDPARNFEESTVTLPNLTWRTEDGGTLLESQRDYSLAYDERRARYLAVRDLRASRNAWSLSFTALSQAQKLLPTDVISVSYGTTGWVNKQFRVLTVKPLPSGEVEITAHEYDAGLYTDAPLTALPPPPATNLPDPFAILPAPSSLTVTTSNQASWAGEVQCRLLATWPAVQGLVVDYQVRWRKQSEATWQSMTTRDTSALLPVVPNAPYFVSVAAVSALGRVGNAITVGATGEGPSGALPDVTGLVCEFGPAGEFIFTWAKSADAVKYAIEISTDGVTRRSDTVIAERYAYTLAMNTADGINRTVTIRVKAISKAGLASANWVARTETNNPPIALSGLSAWSNSLMIAFSCDQPAEVDLAGVICHLGDTANFTPSAATLAYKGRLDKPTLLNMRNGTPLVVGQTYYLKVAAYDVFGESGLVYSASLSVKIFSLSASILEIESLGPEKLSPDLLGNVNKGVSANSALVDSAVPKVVATKPVSKVADVVFVTADKTLYRWDGTKYVDSVAAASLTGKVARSQLETSVVSDIATAVAYEGRIAAVETGKASASSVSNLEAKVAQGTSGNLLLNADFLSVGANGVPNSWSVAGDLPSTNAGVSFWPDWEVTPKSTANTAYIQQIGSGGTWYSFSQEVAIEAGKTYAASVYSGANRVEGKLISAFLDSTGAVVGYAEATNNEEAWGGKTLAEYKRLHSVVKAPASAVAVRITVWKGGTKNGGSSYHFFTRPQLEIVPDGATQPTEWKSGQTAVGDLSSKAELTAQITRIDNVITDVAGKASASSVTSLEAAVEGKLNTKASVTQLSNAISDVEGRSAATSQNQVRAGFNALKKSIAVWPASLGNVPAHEHFYPVYVDLQGVIAGVVDFAFERDSVHEDAVSLGSYSCSVRLRPSVWGHASGVVFSIEQTTGYGPYNWGVGKVEPQLTNNGFLVWLRGGMTHHVKCLTPNVTFTLHHAGYSNVDSSNDGYAFVAHGGGRYEMFHQPNSPLLPYLNKKLLPQGQIEKGSVEGLTQLEATVSAQITRIDTVNTVLGQKAEASSVANLESAVNGKLDTKASVTQLDSAIAGVEGRASATSQNQVSAAVADKVTGAQLNASVAELKTAQIDPINNKLASTWQVTLNAQGKISGVKAYNDGVFSSFDIVADVFRVSTPGSLAAGEAVFSVGSVNGVNKAGLRGDLIVDGSIAARALSVDKLASITASTGELYVSGDLHMTGGAILGGARAGYTWPANGAQNMYIGPGGILMGNANAGKSFQYDLGTGSFTLRGGEIVAGVIRSSNWPTEQYIDLNAGWQGHFLQCGVGGGNRAVIRTDGFAYFDNIYARGNIKASSLEVGAIAAGTVTANEIVGRGVSKVYSGAGSCWYAVAYGDGVCLALVTRTTNGQIARSVEYFYASVGGQYVPATGSTNTVVTETIVIVFER